MAEQLLSLGLDVGTTTTQMVLSELRVENRGTAFTVPDMAITERTIRYQSPVHFTPLLGENQVDGEGIRQLLAAEYQKAGITRSQVDTGAVIITGETSRKENARRVLAALSDFAGEFVVATAGPHLESVLAARGAGAIAYSQKLDKPLLHMDIGGGTSNLALIENGQILRTGCLNVGGRLLKFDPSGAICYVSPALEGLVSSSPDPEAVAQLLAQGLEMAAGLRPTTQLLSQLTTREAGSWTPAPEGAVICFSGGVADCIRQDQPPRCYGDLGPTLGRAIRESRLCAGEYLLGEQTIRATVIGAGCHSTQLSGSTVFVRGVRLPLKNLPVVPFTAREQDSPDLPALIRSRAAQHDCAVVLSFPGFPGGGYGRITALAERIVAGIGHGAVYVAVAQDIAKALGQALCLRLPPERGVLCLDGLSLTSGSYLDVGPPVGPAFPVVIKSLVFGA